MKYAELSKVLRENEAILEAIVDHARGGLPPSITGMTKEAAGLIATHAGRQTSVEFAKATIEQRNALSAQRQREIVEGKKRPEHVLYSHVSATSALIAAYVSRFQWMAEHAN